MLNKERERQEKRLEQRRHPVFPDPTPIDVENNPFWDRYLKYAAEDFAYMKNHIDELLGEYIYHFSIRNYRWWVDRYDEQNINESYLLDLEEEMLPWITKEKEEGRLLDPTQWKPFSEGYECARMYLGYRHLFRFKSFYIQLTLQSRCDYYFCVVCDLDDPDPRPVDTHFIAFIYGSQEGDQYRIRNNRLVYIDGMIPDEQWKSQY